MSKRAIVFLLFSCASQGWWISASQVDASENARSQLEEGITLLRAGQMQAASEQLKAAIHQNPRSIEPYVYLGIAENQLGRFADAVTVLRNALRLDPNSEFAHYNLALSFLGLHKNKEAVQEFRSVVKLNPGNASANYNLALLLADEGSLKEACNYLERARSAQPDDPAILIHLVDLYLRTGNQTGATELIREGTTHDSNGQLSAQIGELLTDKGRFDEAVPLLETARSLLPDTRETTGYLARAYLGANQPAKVIELLAPISEAEASWEVYYLRGLALTSVNQRSDAAQALSKAVSMYDREAPVHYALGKLLLTSEDANGRETGVREINEAIKLSPRTGDYYFTLASYYFDTGNLKATIGLLKSAIEQAPPSEQIYVTLGLAELEVEGPAQATPFIKKAIALDPQAGAGYDLLGRCDMRLGHYDLAAKYYMKAAELTPENDIYFRDAAIALDKLGRPAGGVQFAQKSVRLKPDQVYNRYLLGKLYSQIGQSADAIRELEVCVTLDPHNSLPYNLLATLYKRAGEDAKAETCWQTLRSLKQQSVTQAEEKLSRLGDVPQ